MTTKEKEKAAEYAAKIIAHISVIFREDEECDFKIPQEDLKDNSNVKALIHAIGNMVPTQLYNTVTGDNKNHLEFNHIANHLVFEEAIEHSKLKQSKNQKHE
jgi:thioredoxin reductase